MSHSETVSVAILAGLVAGVAAFGLNIAVNVWLQQAQSDQPAVIFGNRRGGR